MKRKIYHFLRIDSFSLFYKINIMGKTTFYYFVTLLIGNLSANAQTLSSKILDSVSQQPIPYVTVQLKNKGVITNEEGIFSFLLNENIKETDSLFISCIGYESIGEPLHNFTEKVILLQPKAIELNDVILSNKQYTAEEIIDLAKESITKNYNLDISKKRLFFRNSHFQDFYKNDYVFVKSSIDALNKKFLDSVLQSVPKKSSYYSEILCDLYGGFDKNKQKINLIKASELYDKSKDLDFTKLEKKFNEIIKANVKPNSYLKIKSGFFGTKIKGEDFEEFYGREVDSTDTAALKKELEKKKKRQEERKTNFPKYKKKALGEMMQSLFFMEDSMLNFINKPGKYEYTLQDFTYVGNETVYIIDFKSEGSADYKGRLYINADDFAVIRVDYENVKPLKKFSLLGVFKNDYLEKGMQIFSKDSANKYTLRYLEKQSGVRAGIKRPLKIIEKNKIIRGKNKQNELSLKLDMAMQGINKHEVIIFDSKKLTNTQFEAFTESNTILPTYMPNYNPEFWKGHNIIEPNQAIKEFTSETAVE